MRCLISYGLDGSKPNRVALRVRRVKKARHNAKLPRQRKLAIGDLDHTSKRRSNTVRAESVKSFFHLAAYTRLNVVRTNISSALRRIEMRQYALSRRSALHPELAVGDWLWGSAYPCEQGGCLVCGARRGAN